MPWMDKVVKLRSKKSRKIVGERKTRVFVHDAPSEFHPEARVIEIPGAAPRCALGLREKGKVHAEECDFYCRVRGSQGVFRYECREHQAITGDEIMVTFKRKDQHGQAEQQAQVPAPAQARRRDQPRRSGRVG